MGTLTRLMLCVYVILNIFIVHNKAVFLSVMLSKMEQFNITYNPAEGIRGLMRRIAHAEIQHQADEKSLRDLWKRMDAFPRGRQPILLVNESVPSLHCIRIGSGWHSEVTDWSVYIHQQLHAEATADLTRPHAFACSVFDLAALAKAKVSYIERRKLITRRLWQTYRRPILDQSSDYNINYTVIMGQGPFQPAKIGDNHYYQVPPIPGLVYTAAPRGTYFCIGFECGSIPTHCVVIDINRTVCANFTTSQLRNNNLGYFRELVDGHPERCEEAVSGEERVFPGKVASCRLTPFKEKGRWGCCWEYRNTTALDVFWYSAPTHDPGVKDLTHCHNAGQFLARQTLYKKDNLSCEDNLYHNSTEE